jgi:hypothetical protein
MSASTKLEPALRAAFLAAVPAAVGNTAFENQAFDPKGKEKWYIFSFIPNRPEVATLGSAGSDAITGLVQIDLNIKEGRGRAAVDDLESLLRAAFPAGQRVIYDTVNILIKACGRNGNGRPVDGFYRYTFTIDWETRIKRTGVSLEILQAVQSDDVDLVTWEE